MNNLFLQMSQLERNHRFHRLCAFLSVESVVSKISNRLEACIVSYLRLHRKSLQPERLPARHEPVQYVRHS